MSEQTLTNVAAPLAIPADEAARLCGVSRGFWWKLHSSGRCPLPVRLGRKTLWRVEELKAWLAAGCPERLKWNALRNQPARKGGAR